MGAVAVAEAVVASGEAGGAGGFEADMEGGEAGIEVVFGDGEEGGLGGLVGGFEGLGDLVEGLADARVVAAHCFGCTRGDGRVVFGAAEMGSDVEMLWQWLGMVHDHTVGGSIGVASSLEGRSGTGP